MREWRLHSHRGLENIVVGFARLAGKSIGVVANQPAYLAGTNLITLTNFIGLDPCLRIIHTLQAHLD